MTKRMGNDDLIRLEMRQYSNDIAIGLTGYTCVAAGEKNDNWSTAETAPIDGSWIEVYTDRWNGASDLRTCRWIPTSEKGGYWLCPDKTVIWRFDGWRPISKAKQEALDLMLAMEAFGFWEAE